MLRHHILCPSVSPGLRVTWQDCSRETVPYEIFRKDLLGTPVWMESAKDLASAELRMTQLLNRSPGEYFIVSQETGEIASETPAKFALSVPNPAL